MNASWVIPFMSLAIDHFGWFRMGLHPLNIWRSLVAAARRRRHPHSQVLKARQ
jgi:hypothetical protein